jgi:integrase
MKRRGNGEGHISKLANGKYFAQIYINGSRPSQTFDTQKAAQIWLTGLKDAANKGKYINPSQKPLEVYWDKWISVDKAKSVSPATLLTYAYSRARLPEKLLKMPISEITRQDIQEALNGINGKRRTVEMTRTALNMCFNQAVEDKLIRESPVQKTTLPAREPRKSKAYAQAAKIDFINYCMSSPRTVATGKRTGEPWKLDIKEQAYKDALLLILRTGIRREECCNLIWSDWTDNSLQIRGTKNARAYRSVPLTHDIIDLLKRRHKTAESIYIFEICGKRILGSSLYHFSKSKFGKSIHSLRHTLGFDAMKAGVNPRVVQEILGHADVRTTLQIYTDVDEQEKAAAVIKIAAQCNFNVMMPVITEEQPHNYSNSG